MCHVFYFPFRFYFTHFVHIPHFIVMFNEQHESYISLVMNLETYTQNNSRFLLFRHTKKEKKNPSDTLLLPLLSFLLNISFITSTSRHFAMSTTEHGVTDYKWWKYIHRNISVFICMCVLVYTCAYMCNVCTDAYVYVYVYRRFRKCEKVAIECM